MKLNISIAVTLYYAQLPHTEGFIIEGSKEIIDRLRETVFTSVWVRQSSELLFCETWVLMKPSYNCGNRLIGEELLTFIDSLSSEIKVTYTLDARFVLEYWVLECQCIKNGKSYRSEEEPSARLTKPEYILKIIERYRQNNQGRTPSSEDLFHFLEACEIVHKPKGIQPRMPNAVMLEKFAGPKDENENRRYSFHQPGKVPDITAEDAAMPESIVRRSLTS